MDDFMKLRTLYQLKHVKRRTTVEERKESPAEHSWSSLVLADYFLDRTQMKLDKLKVFQLLIYHDVVEIEAGDIPIHYVNRRKDKKETELKAMKKIAGDLPLLMQKKYEELFLEFSDISSPEAGFAQAIDKLDAILQALDNKVDWLGWDEKLLRKLHEHRFLPYPEIMQVFEDIVVYVKENGYFPT